MKSARLLTTVLLLFLFYTSPHSYAYETHRLRNYSGYWTDWEVNTQITLYEFPFYTTVQSGVICFMSTMAYGYNVHEGVPMNPSGLGWTLPDSVLHPFRGISDWAVIDSAGRAILRSEPTYFPEAEYAGLTSCTILRNFEDLFFLTSPDSDGVSSIAALPDVGIFHSGRYGSFVFNEQAGPEMFHSENWMTLPLADTLGVELITFNENATFFEVESTETIASDTLFANPVGYLPAEGLTVINQPDSTTFEFYQYSDNPDRQFYLAHTLETPPGRFTMSTVNQVNEQQVAWVIQHADSASIYLGWSQNQSFRIAGEVTRIRLVSDSRLDGFGNTLLFSVYQESLDQTALYYVALVSEHLDIDHDPDSHQPTSFTMLPAYPNPFNASTVIPFELNRVGQIRVVAYDLLGRKVGLVEEGMFTPGQHLVSWQPDPSLASGTYLLQLNTESESVTQRITLVK